MKHTVHRCPDCGSSVVLERDLEGLTLACMGCSRRWTRPSDAQLRDQREIAQMRAERLAAAAARQRKDRIALSA